MISAVDWAELFGSVSLADALLRDGSDFAELDFATRNSYRAAIEELARGSQLPELDVTREVLRVAADPRPPAPAQQTDGRRTDPGTTLSGPEGPASKRRSASARRWRAGRAGSSSGSGCAAISAPLRY